MAIHRNYMRLVMLLIPYLFVASWIQINYESATGAVYIAMGLIVLIFYSIAETLGFKDITHKLFGIDDNWSFDTVLGVIVGLIIIAAMEVSFVTMGYPSSIYPQTAFAEKVTLFSMFLVIAFLASVGEEITFRGMFAWFAWHSLKYYTIAIILSSAAFAAFHFQAYGAFLPAAYVGAFLIGITLSMIAQQTKSLLPCIIIHSMINVHLFIKAEQLMVIGV